MYDDEIDFYYLRSRYYNANRGRFINADDILSDCNLFTYCKNNPESLTDSDGKSAVEAAAEFMLIASASDGPGPLGDIVGIVGALSILLVGVLLDKNSPDISDHSIDTASIVWYTSDENHILKGSKKHNGHDWSNFGITPNDPNGWEKLLPLLKKVVEQDMEINRFNTEKGQVRDYVLYFRQYSEEIFVRIFIPFDSRIPEFTDAWPIQ